MTHIVSDARAVTDQELEAIFQPVFSRIREGALERERDRRLPFDEIGWLREAGFGRLRVPVQAGGFGASVDQLARLLIQLGAADSNIPQALRGHIGFTEFVLAHPEPAYRDHWLAALSAGTLVGNAESERTGTFAAQSTRVVEQDGRLLLNGTKYYTTGSIFADWILVSVLATHPETGEPGFATVQVSTAADGVSIHDDWDGFGQRLTGSGTAEFVDVEVDPRFLHFRGSEEAGGGIQHAVYQLVHLANLAGIASAALEEIAGFVRSRTRNLFNPAIAPNKDQVSLQIIGEAFGTVETVKAAVLAAARTVQQASVAQQEGTAVVGDFSRADAHVFGIQPIVIDQVLRLISRVFEVGGASATSSSRQLDRLWRNARTISSHNPAIYRQQAVGDYVINGVGPGAALLQLLTAVPAGHSG
jgi:alkylation response protein AidB-like acyl-CoA dehydrogenase